MTRCLLSAIIFSLVILTLVGIPPAARASGNTVRSDPGILLVPPPMLEPPQTDGSRCFHLINRAPYTVIGAIITNYEINLAGILGRKNANFRVTPGERIRVCTRGPYYAGTRVELVLRTIVPIFSCYTVAQGEVSIYGEHKAGGGTRTWANCQ